MKAARTSQGTTIYASEKAPEKAFCPACGGLVMLRTRKLMANGGTIYYWRHEDNQNACRRPRPVMHVRYQPRYMAA